MENWKQIPFAPNYEVSDLGRIKRIALGQGVSCQKILEQIDFTPAGYRRFRFSHKGKISKYTLHRIVAITFLGPPPTEKHVVCHNDGNKLNNVLLNLRWDTTDGNQRDKVLHGNSLKGEKQNNAKLNCKAVKDIRESTEKASKLAIKYGVHEETIRRIIKRQSWTHV